MSWLVMVGTVIGFGAAMVAYRELNKRNKIAGLLVVGAIFAGCLAAAIWAGQHRERAHEHVEVPSPDQHHGVLVERRDDIRTEEADRGLMIALRYGDGELPSLVIRTLSSIDGTAEANYRDAVDRISGSFEDDFRPVALAFAPNARAASWRTSERRMFVWSIERAAGVTTFLTCTTNGDGDPERDCARLLSAVSLDPSFRVRTETFSSPTSVAATDR